MHKKNKKEYFIIECLLIFKLYRLVFLQSISFSSNRLLHFLFFRLHSEKEEDANSENYFSHNEVLVGKFLDHNLHLQLHTETNHNIHCCILSNVQRTNNIHNLSDHNQSLFCRSVPQLERKRGHFTC